MCTLFMIWMLLDSTPSHWCLLWPSSVDSSHLIHHASSSLQYLCSTINSLLILFSESYDFYNQASSPLFPVGLASFYFLCSFQHLKKIDIHKNCVQCTLHLCKTGKVTSYFCSLLLLNVLCSTTLAVHGL